MRNLAGLTLLVVLYAFALFDSVSAQPNTEVSANNDVPTSKNASDAGNTQGNPVNNAAGSSPLVAAFANFPPYMYTDDSGHRAGFMVELVEEIAAELGLALEFIEARTSKEFVENQVSGKTQIVAGILRLPPLENSNVFSDVAASEEFGLVSRTTDVAGLSKSPVQDLRIGIVPPALGSHVQELLLVNTAVEYPSPEAVLMDLLTTDLDAALIPNPVAFDIARSASIDHLIGFVDPPIKQITRHVAVHRSRADLLPRINEVIAAMHADGRMSALIERNFIQLPKGQPEVLTIGYSEFPPYKFTDTDGKPSGYSVEILENLAARADLQFRFIPISETEWERGPREGEFDMLTLANISPEKRQRMDFTLPTLESRLSIFTRTGGAANLSDLNSLTGRSVGVVEGHLAEAVARNHGGLTLKSFRSRVALLDGLVSDDVDAALFTASNFKALAEDKGMADQIYEVAPPFHIAIAAPAVRFGLGIVRENLNAVIPGFLASAEHQRLQNKYFSDPVFWTPFRIYSSLALTAALSLLVPVGYILWQRQKQIKRQQQDLEREKQYSTNLAALVADLERSNRDLDEFAYTASHDLKEPLRGISINANFFARETLTADGQKRVSRIIELTKRMERLVGDLLYVSRLGRSDETTIVNVDVEALVGTISSELREWIEERNGVITVATGLPSVFGDPARIRSLFQNLIVNGIKYNDSATKSVEIAFHQSAVVNASVKNDVFSVKDNGIGIDEKHRANVFKLFQRLNAHDTYGSGSGAGLSVVRKIIESYNGWIDFVSEPGGGTTFFFTLPTTRDRDT
jgi:signal transduction histidine kinase